MLLLFDIDGTLLLKAAAAHRDAIYVAIQTVWGVEQPDDDHLDTAGRTDQEIARELLLLAGVDRQSDAQWEAFRDAAVAAYAARVPADLSDRIAPGIPAVLDGFAADHTLSLVTGNLEPIARMKLKAAGLHHHFAAGQGGFGSDEEDRTLLPPLARRRAGRIAGLDTAWPRDETVVIGDTERDIACAHADGVACIAISTGPIPHEDLHRADAVVRTAAELPAALAAL